MYLAILGRQPDLSLAELISLYGDGVTLVNDWAAIVSSGVDFDRLGGTIKLARIEMEYPTSHWNEISKRLLTDLDLSHLEGKVRLGVSVYGREVSDKKILALGLEIKKLLKQRGVSAGIVPTKNQVVSSAQVLHNHLVGPGLELVLVMNDNHTWVGITTAVQDIEAYGARDHDRPARSAKVGMLPPKLAQIMINLANPARGSTVLDPFCGTGVVLQEAALTGFGTFGSDIDESLIKMSRQNLNWLAEKTGKSLAYDLAVGDATTMKWPSDLGAVVTEGYLGPALTKLPAEDELSGLKRDATKLTLDFLTNLHSQIKPGTPICLCLPAWRRERGFERLEIIDQITALGYTLEQFLPVRQSDLLYNRPDQIVGRELITLRRT